jgi:hypothetical protein
LASECNAPNDYNQSEALSMHYATLENGKQHCLGQDTVVTSNKHTKDSTAQDQIDTRPGRKGRRGGGERWPVGRSRFLLELLLMMDFPYPMCLI